VKRVVLVSGATGFIGSHLCEDMQRAGHRVRAIGRRRAERLDPSIEQFVVPDLTDSKAIGQACEGVDWVVHAAGLAHVVKSPRDGRPPSFAAANVETARAFTEATVSSGVSALALISSIAATENIPPERDYTARVFTGYAQSKRESELAVASAARGSTLRTIILRAPMVHGPDMKGNPLRLLRLIERRIPLPLSGIRNERSLLYVLNLAAAVRFALEAPRLAGTFLVTDRDKISTPELARLFARELGVKTSLLRVPRPVLTTLGMIGDVVNRFAPFAVDSQTLARLTGSTTEVGPANGGAQLLPGFTPPFSTSEGIRSTVAWYKSTSRRNR
jgi:nucleoside-diphosphate-sugar epimerase